MTGKLSLDTKNNRTLSNDRRQESKKDLDEGIESTVLLNRLLVDSFRGLKNAEFCKLNRVNYVVGENNSGKTSVLEALVAGGCYSDSRFFLDTMLARSQKMILEGVKNMLRPVGEEISRITITFSNGSTLKTELTCKERTEILQSDNKIKNKRLLTMTVNSIFGDGQLSEPKTFWVNFEQNDKKTFLRRDPSLEHKKKNRIPCQFVSFSRFDRTDKILEVLDGVFINNQREKLLDVLKIFDPNVVNFEVVGEDRQILVFGKDDHESDPLYLNDYGNGMYKAFYIACAALQATNGILLIDELEAGIHHRALVDFITYLDTISKKQNIQLFITTHSLELLDVARQTHHDGDMVVYKIKRGEGKSVVKRINHNDMDLLRGELGVDIR